jgi:aspartyl-tRNA(Asn)/glutamyl-tRNA(Gln) amidotransferase subunit B
MNSLAEKYEAVIGLEIHAQLLTESKIFCSCSTEYGSPPNTNICPICIGHPGVLPVLNMKAVELAVRFGVATDSRINRRSVMARKNYFYPDLPKGYQISQYSDPVCEEGFIELDKGTGGIKRIRIRRSHLEEDAGKLIHELGTGSLVDLNRCGVPLLEIVTEPDIRDPREAHRFLEKLKLILQYLDICDGNMEQGSLRCDANVSVRLGGDSEMGTKTEIKNMNSFRNVERGIQFEIKRQIEILEEGGKVTQETLLWDDNSNTARPMRSKEEAHDYRYFPDPDLMPVIIEPEVTVSITSALPELPENRRKRFQEEYKLPAYDAELLTSDKNLADFFEEMLKTTDDFKSASNWVMGDILKILNEEKVGISGIKIKPPQLADLINLINEKTISGKLAKDVFEEMLKSGEDPGRIIEEKNLFQIVDESAIASAVNGVLEKFDTQVNEYLSGKEKVLGFLVGQIMKSTQGKANPKMVNELLIEKLNALRGEKE